MKHASGDSRISTSLEYIGKFCMPVRMRIIMVLGISVVRMAAGLIDCLQGLLREQWLTFALKCRTALHLTFGLNATRQCKSLEIVQ